MGKLIDVDANLIDMIGGDLGLYERWRIAIPVKTGDIFRYTYNENETHVFVVCGIFNNGDILTYMIGVEKDDLQIPLRAPNGFRMHILIMLPYLKEWPPFVLPKDYTGPTKLSTASSFVWLASQPTAMPTSSGGFISAGYESKDESLKELQNQSLITIKNIRSALPGLAMCNLTFKGVDLATSMYMTRIKEHSDYWRIRYGAELDDNIKQLIQEYKGE